MTDQTHSRDAAADLALVHSASPARPATGSGGSRPAIPAITAFSRTELAILLNLYGRKVAAGDWRDYALDFLKDRALFSIYQHNSDRPLYMVEKCPRLRNKQGQYMVTGHQGRVLKRGHDLAQVLRVLDPQFRIVK